MIFEKNAAWKSFIHLETLSQDLHDICKHFYRAYMSFLGSPHFISDPRNNKSWMLSFGTAWKIKNESELRNRKTIITNYETNIIFQWWWQGIVRITSTLNIVQTTYPSGPVFLKGTSLRWGGSDPPHLLKKSTGRLAKSRSLGFTSPMSPWSLVGIYLTSQTIPGKHV